MDPLKQLSVLLIDDDSNTQAIFEFIFGHNPFRLATRSDASGGLDYLARNPSDVIIVDMMLPDGYGSQLLKRIRENPATRNSKVILTSAYFRHDARLDMLELGFDGFLAKPLSVLDVIPYIEHVLHGD